MVQLAVLFVGNQSIVRTLCLNLYEGSFQCLRLYLALHEKQFKCVMLCLSSYERSFQYQKLCLALR
jgi:hypothetical protein